ncbi:3-deoxy-D-manno-octulosonic acid transferase [hydrothermal vent metagenome]|uniref:lipid IVA 3-deoxy-D-manno-octulosonic acid transferase n=1 Tax=hydrothermal vent metagenome TaxID=652676 RepID=A0A3B0YG38_9ZZZZ
MHHCNKAAGCYDRGVKRLYTFLLYLALPWVLLRLWWRGFRQPAIRRHWRERLGVVGAAKDRPGIWVHAVSVGEVRAAEPLVNALLQRYPKMPLLITTTTPTGRDTVTRLFGDRVRCRYLPWDLPFAVRRFLTSVRPGKVIVMETELWPNLFHALKQRGIPLYLVNARLSDKSLRGYRRIPSLVRDTLACVTGIAAQSEMNAHRFVALGAPAERVIPVGNLKYEVELPANFDQRLASLKKKFNPRESLWVAASTHPGEERIVLAAHRQLLTHNPECLLLLVPRHPERAEAVAQLCRQSGMSVTLYSGLAESLRSEGSTDNAPGTSQVLVIDVLGELACLYGLAPVAFIGGSLVPHGGHNPLEALQAGCTVISGRYTGNFVDIYRRLEDAGAVTRVEDDAMLADALETLFNDDELRQRQLAAGGQVLEDNRGALRRVLALTEAKVSS